MMILAFRKSVKNKLKFTSQILFLRNDYSMAQSYAIFGEFTINMAIKLRAHSLKCHT